MKMYNNDNNESFEFEAQEWRKVKILMNFLFQLYLFEGGS